MFKKQNIRPKQEVFLKHDILYKRIIDWPRFLWKLPREFIYCIRTHYSAATCKLPIREDMLETEGISGKK